MEAGKSPLLKRDLGTRRRTRKERRESFSSAHIRAAASSKNCKKLQSIGLPDAPKNWTKTGQNCPVFKVGRARVFRKISENLGITPLCQRLYVLVQRGFFEFFESVATEKIWEKMRVPKQQLPAHEG